MALLSYHGRPELKEERLAIVAKHRELDLLGQGYTGTPSRGEKGCAVACTVDGYQHSRYPVELGIPEAWARLEDSIFEGLEELRAAQPLAAPAEEGAWRP